MLRDQTGDRDAGDLACGATLGASEVITPVILAALVAAATGVRVREMPLAG